MRGGSFKGKTILGKTIKSVLMVLPFTQLDKIQFIPVNCNLKLSNGVNRFAFPPRLV